MFNIPRLCFKCLVSFVKSAYFQSFFKFKIKLIFKKSTLGPVHDYFSVNYLIFLSSPENVLGFFHVFPKNIWANLVISRKTEIIKRKSLLSPLLK